MSKTDTSEEGLESLIMHHLTGPSQANSPLKTVGHPA